jgi:hypothetical protein
LTNFEHYCHANNRYIIKLIEYCHTSQHWADNKPKPYVIPNLLW